DQLKHKLNLERQQRQQQQLQLERLQMELGQDPCAAETPSSSSSASAQPEHRKAGRRRQLDNESPDRPRDWENSCGSTASNAIQEAAHMASRRNKPLSAELDTLAEVAAGFGQLLGNGGSFMSSPSSTSNSGSFMGSTTHASSRTGSGSPVVFTGCKVPAMPTRAPLLQVGAQLTRNGSMGTRSAAELPMAGVRSTGASPSAHGLAVSRSAGALGFPQFSDHSGGGRL
ncbi:unnamed protein product, partial [Polarella glacialis]